MKQFFTTFFSCFVVLFLSAQSSKILKSGGSLQSQLSSAYGQAKQMGLSDKEISNQLIKRGFSAKMIEESKKMFQNRGSLSLGNSMMPSMDTSADNQLLKRDTNWVFKTPLPKRFHLILAIAFSPMHFLIIHPIPIWLHRINILLVLGMNW
jgi:high-affinity nickel permease